MLNLFQHLLPKAILTQILEILKEILKQVQDDKSVQDDSELNLDALALFHPAYWVAIYGYLWIFMDKYYSDQDIVHLCCHPREGGDPIQNSPGFPSPPPRGDPQSRE